MITDMYPHPANKKEKKEDGYERLFVVFSERCESYIRITLSVLIGLLIVAQILLQFPGVRYHLSQIDRLEGQPIQR